MARTARGSDIARDGLGPPCPWGCSRNCVRGIVQVVCQRARSGGRRWCLSFATCVLARTGDCSPRSSALYRCTRAIRGSNGIELIAVNHITERWYKSGGGRFSQADPVAQPTWQEPHLFAYVHQNPLRSADPLGLYTVDQSVAQQNLWIVSGRGRSPSV